LHFAFSEKRRRVFVSKAFVMPEWRPKRPAKVDYGIGIVGTGAIVQSHHLLAYRKAGLNVRALCDINEETLLTAGKKFGVENLQTDYRRLLDDPAIQIIDIATQPEVREPIILDALSAGKHLLIQKPLTHLVEQAYRYLSAVEHSGVKAAVNQTERWYPRDAKVIALVHNGFIGDLQSLMIVSVGGGDRVWGGPTWRGRLQHFYIRELTIHHVEAFRVMSGHDPVRVTADGARMSGQMLNSETLSNVIVEFPGEQRLYDVCQLAARGGIRWGYWTVFGVEGTLHVERSEIVIYRDGESGNPHRVPCDEPTADAFVGVLYDLMECIETGAEPKTSIRRNLPNVAAIVAAGISVEERRPVEIRELL
jgi:predicted dehydrogenase